MPDLRSAEAAGALECCRFVPSDFEQPDVGEELVRANGSVRLIILSLQTPSHHSSHRYAPRVVFHLGLCWWEQRKRSC